MASPAHRTSVCRGWTMLELLVVLAIVALLVGLSLPAMRGPLARRELRHAAKRVRMALARARLEAIESGTAQQFRFQPGNGRFEVAPKPSFGIGRPLSGPGSGASAADRPGENEVTRFDLLPGVCFGNQEGVDLSPTTPARSGGLDSPSWSAPLIFYPNGRGCNARIRLCGRDDLYVDVILRGITGSVTIGQLVRGEEQP